MSDEDMTQLLAAVEDRLGSSWVETVEWLRDTNQVDDIAARLRVGDIDGAVKGVEAAATRIAKSIHDAYIDSGEAAAAVVDALKPAKLVTFNSTNTRAAEWARINNADLVREVSAETRKVISDVVSRGVAAGTNPRAVARDIRDSIGLTAHQETHVASYRRALEQGDFGNALGRELRDKRSDRTLAKAERDGIQLTEAQIDRMVDKYRANYVAHRATVIARTEGLRALHEGTNEAYQQSIDDGTLEADELIQQWHSAADARVRDSHTHVVDADTGLLTKYIGVGYWRTQDGNLLQYPGDPTAPAEDIIQCRCVVSTTVNPNVQPITTAPAGFDAQGMTVRDGIPAIDNIRPGALYRVSQDDLDGKLVANAEGKDNQAKIDNIKQGWADGKQLPPVNVLIAPNGKLYVDNGRHRLSVAEEQDRDVLIRFGTTTDDVVNAGVPL